MTTQLPSLPSADLSRLSAVDPQDLVLAALAFDRAASEQTLGRRLKPWGLAPRQMPVVLAALERAGLAKSRNGRWSLTQAGRAEAARRFDLEAGLSWPAFAERQFTTHALGLDPAQRASHAYLAGARNFYACALAVLFDLADPATHPGLSAMRAALVWRVAAARCPDLLSTAAPSAMTGLKDPLSRTLYVRFAGLARGSVDQATPALLRRILPGASASASGLRRALVRTALTGEAMEDPEMPPTEPRAATPAQPEPADFAREVVALARRLKTPKAKGGHFTGGQVAIAQVYDAYTENGHAPLTLDDFKSRLWAAVRAGADFHLTRLDIPDLMDDDLRERSATPTRAGDVVHFVVLD